MSTFLSDGVVAIFSLKRASSRKNQMETIDARASQIQMQLVSMPNA